MKRNGSGVLLLLAVACLASACSPRRQPATGEAAKIVSNPQTGAGPGASTAHSEPSSPGTGEEPGAGCPRGCATPPAGCLIKGNINLKTGDRVYHVPGQLHYNDVTIESERGEFWFCTEDEAQANGWRRAKR